MICLEGVLDLLQLDPYKSPLTHLLTLKQGSTRKIPVPLQKKKTNWEIDKQKHVTIRKIVLSMLMNC